NQRDDDQDTVRRSPPREFSPVLTSVGNDQEQIPVDNTVDPRDRRETSFSSDEDGEGVQILTERQREKRPQFMQEIPVDRAQPHDLITREDIANLITALRSTNETL
ncbi:hypothetical protein A2U01_0068941, partial [Trifolium medium]|nr:hypothetical protein [Trifolium medium]